MQRNFSHRGWDRVFRAGKCDQRAWVAGFRTLDPVAEAIFLATAAVEPSPRHFVGLSRRWKRSTEAWIADFGGWGRLQNGSVRQFSGWIKVDVRRAERGSGSREKVYTDSCVTVKQWDRR